MKQNAINEEDRARFELYAEIYKGIDDVEHGRVKSLEMDLNTFNEREAALDLRERLKDVDEARNNRLEDMPANKVSELMRIKIKEHTHVSSCECFERFRNTN